MIGKMEFGEWDALAGHSILEEFHWRGIIRLAIYRLHPSGRELVAVIGTSRRVGQTLPKR
jgi:hypothetical protein